MPTLDQAQVMVAYPAIAAFLFGPDGFSPDGPFLLEPVRKFVDNLMVHTWQRYRKSQMRESKRRDALVAEEARLWRSK
jgi:hypothetical protein